MTITVPPGTFATIEGIAQDVAANRARPVTPEEIAASWQEIDGAPDHVKEDLRRERLIRSPTWEPDAGQLAMVLKMIGAYLGGQITSSTTPPVVQVALVVPPSGDWRCETVPLSTTCDYATRCKRKPETRRKLIGRAGCCRKAGHVDADVDSITAFADDTRADFQHEGDIAFTVNPDDLKAGAYPLR